MGGWTIRDWHDLLSIAAMAAVAILSVGAFYLRSTFAKHRDLEKATVLFGEGLRRLEERVAACEVRHATAPDAGRVNEMALALERTSTSLEALDQRFREGLQRVNERLSRIEDYLLNGNRP